jgi:uncharacterized protein (DUF58 family)
MSNHPTYISPEVLEKIRNVTFHTRRLMRGSSAGLARSIRKGMGFDFEALREYAVGDDVRFIDWKASARAQSFLVKEFRQEQRSTILIVIDISSSMEFGSDEKKSDRANRVATAIILIANYARDAVGLVLYSDEVELFIPPAKGVAHSNRIIQELFTWKPKEKKKTNSSSVMQHLLRYRMRNAFLFWFSDCLETAFTKHLTSIASIYQLYVIKSIDMHEQSLPSIGWLCIEDSETGDCGYAHIGASASLLLKQFHEKQNNAIKNSGAQLIMYTTVINGIEQIVRLFDTSVCMQ